MNKAKHCNICGKELNFFDKQENFSFDKELGYGSEHDGERLRIHICCGCMDKLINRCVISPIEEQ